MTRVPAIVRIRAECCQKRYSMGRFFGKASDGGNKKARVHAGNQ
jgi:hypothetical protein